MYTSHNFPSKKALKEAVAAGRTVTVFQPGLGTVPDNGRVCLEGPHYPQPHKWYATAVLQDGKIISVK